MRLENERKEEVYAYDIDCTDEERNQLKAFAIEMFAKDEPAQIEYAIVHILKEEVEKEEMQEFLKKAAEKAKGKENGDENNSGKQDVDSATSSD